MKKNSQRPIIVHNSGQSLIEVVIALAFAAFIIVALVNVTVTSIKSAQFARNQEQAVKLAQEGIEWVRSQRDSNPWDLIAGNSGVAPLGKDYCINDLVWTVTTCTHFYKDEDVFKRTLNLTDTTYDLSGKVISLTATVTVGWTDSAGLHKSVQKTVMSNWQGK